MPWLNSADSTYVDKSGGDFRLNEDLIYIDHDGKQWITPAGFVSDLSSIPRSFRWAFSKTRLGKAPWLHDLNYRHNPYQITRKKADQLYRDGAIDEGMRGIWANLLYAGLRAGGWASWKG